MNQVTTQQNRPPLVQFKHDLTALQEAGELALPDTVSFKAFKNAAVVAITDNPQILNCKRETVFKAIRTLAAAGLVPDGREAAIVPYNGAAQAMPMVGGLVKIARNSGKITSLWADVVYQGESLDIWVEDGERKWNHVNVDGSRINAMERGGDIVGAYAVAKLTDGTVEFQPMSWAEIDQRRRSSANQKGDKPTGIWAQWTGEMAKKTVIRNLCKRLPMSSEDMERIMKEQDQQPLRDITPPREERPNLAQRLAGAPEKPQEADPEPEAPDVPDAEVMPATDEHSASLTVNDLDLSEAFPGSYEFTEGVKAFKAGQFIADCPYLDDRQKATDWCGGWAQASEAEGPSGERGESST